jgi:hypothetical protein
VEPGERDLGADTRSWSRTRSHFGTAEWLTKHHTAVFARVFTICLLFQLDVRALVLACVLAGVIGASEKLGELRGAVKALRLMSSSVRAVDRVIEIRQIPTAMHARLDLGLPFTRETCESLDPRFHIIRATSQRWGKHRALLDPHHTNYLLLVNADDDLAPGEVFMLHHELGHVSVTGQQMWQSRHAALPQAIAMACVAAPYVAVPSVSSGVVVALVGLAVCGAWAASFLSLRLQAEVHADSYAVLALWDHPQFPRILRAAIAARRAQVAKGRGLTRREANARLQNLVASESACRESRSAATWKRLADGLVPRLTLAGIWIPVALGVALSVFTEVTWRTSLVAAIVMVGLVVGQGAVARVRDGERARLAWSISSKMGGT